MMAAAEIPYPMMRLDMVKLLEANGANVDESVKPFHSPLIRAVKLGHINVVEYLLDKGVNIHQYYDNKNPFLWACSNGHAQIAE